MITDSASTTTRILIAVAFALWLGVLGGLMAIAPSPYMSGIEKAMLGLIFLPIPVIGAAALISGEPR